MSYKNTNNQKHVKPMKKNSGFVVLGGGILWVYFAIAGASVATVDIYLADDAPTAVAQTPAPELAKN